MTTHMNLSRVIGLVILGIVVGWAIPGQPTTSAKETRRIDRPRIAYMNIAKVLRDFESANVEGMKITKSRQESAASLNDKKDNLAKINNEHDGSDDPNAKRELASKAAHLRKEIEEFESKAQANSTEIQNSVIVKVYDQIKTIATDVAKEYGLDVVEAFPAAPEPRDQNSPAVSQLMLQTPALMPFYLNPEFDVTDDVVDRLNKKYPAKK